MDKFEEIIKYSKNLTLLYVEDEPNTREITAMILEDFFKNVIVAKDGADGYTKFQENDVDLIITDINMPVLSGLEMSKKIRQSNNEVPIIVVSAHNEEDFFLQSIHIGINGYLFKPIDIDQLTNTIFNVIQKYKYIHQSQENLHLLQEYQKAANESSIVSKTDTKGIITYVNDAFCKISGYTQEELLGKNHNIVRHPDTPKEIYKNLWHTIKEEKKIWKGIIRNKAKNGKSYYVDSLVMPLVDLEGNILEYISLRHDITDIMNPVKQLQEELSHARNPLLIFIKLEDFQDIEELYDSKTIHEIGYKTATYLDTLLSQHYIYDKLYNLENGEYAIVLNATQYTQNQKAFIHKLKEIQIQIQRDKISLESLEYDISVLITMVTSKNKIYESAKLGIKQLIKTKENFLLADNLALIKQESAKKNMQTISMIKNALQNSKIISYFQPIVDNKTQKTVKYESLVRLIDEKGEVLSPYFFLETAKRSKYYLKITNVVLAHSFSILQNSNVDISINLSALDIEQIAMREKIYAMLEQNKQNTHRVVFELLEDEKIKDFQAVKDFIRDVKTKYGVKIAIDDFGAGYSNFERLLEYQPDILKIDGCLIRNIDTSSYSYSVVKSIVTFAKEQNLQTIAEFIENGTIFHIVKELGIDFSQGYYFGKPEPL